MAFKVQILRPDDLLNLQIECWNLRLDTSDPEQPALIPVNAAEDSHLVITFPPQSIAEAAFFEVAPVPAPPPPPPPPPAPPDPPEGPPPTIPVGTRIGGPTRLVFRIPASAGTSIPYSVTGLLGWVAYELSVSPIADVPENPTLQQIAAAGNIRAPQALETAVEMPYRVVLSPRVNVHWLHSAEAVAHNGRTELWHTRLALRGIDGSPIELSRTSPASLRAIWSQDFNPTTLPPMGTPDPDLGVTAMSPHDRHSVVVLTSAFSGYVNENNTRYLPLPIHAEQFMLSPLGGWLKSRGNWEPPYKRFSFIGRIPLQRWDRFFSSALVDRGAVPAAEIPEEVVQDAGEQPPGEAARALSPGIDLGDLAVAHGDVFIPGIFGFFKGEPLSLSEWVHIATLGRDHHVRIVYEGHLFPFMHRAALIKITERQIRNVSGNPVAYLVQRMFIVVREPVKVYTDVPNDGEVTGPKPQFAHYDRYMPFLRVRLTTLVTPDIDHPKTGKGHIPGTDFSTWVMVNVGGSIQDFKFHAVAEDIAENRAEFTASLIFIPFSENNRAAVPSAYTAEGDRRACIVPEENVTYAPRDPDPETRTDNTTLVTRALYFKTEGVDLNKKYGGFLPELLKADVRIPAVEQLLGRETTTTIALTKPYQDNGLVNAGGVFAQIAKEIAGVMQADKLPVEFQAKQAGGIATPNMDVSCLSRRFGPLAGDIAKAEANSFEPASFFPPGSAQLFGVLDLSALIQGALSIADNAPKTQFATEDIPGGKKLVTRLEWQPKITDPPKIGILQFIAKDPDTGAPSNLTINALLEKPIKFPPAPPAAESESTARFSGVLSDFTLDFLNVIRLKFKSFSFESVNGSKMNVDVKLDGNQPVRFQGDLEFVEKLRDLIPPGVLGGGPSLDINAQRIRAGFAIALPPASVGVFSLKGISLSTALELPFIDGKPTFDFGFSERHHPFNLTVSLLGGGGFFHLQLDTLGIKQLEAAIEFGACAALDIGVASGSVHIMAGIYFAMQKKDGVMMALLSGYLRAGGELSVLGIVSISVEFNLSFTYYIDAGKCKGRATLTVTVEIAFFSKTVELSVEKSFGKGGGDPTFAQLMTSPVVWDEYASAFA